MNIINNIMKKTIIITNKDKSVKIPKGWKIDDILGYSQAMSSTQGFIKYAILSIAKI